MASRESAELVGRRLHASLLLVIVAGAVFIRFYGLDRQGVRFVDEGEYCQFGLALREGVKGQIIDKPGHALLVCASYGLWGVDMASPLRLSAWLGVASVLAVYGLGRVLYDRAAGLVAASSVAFMPLCLFYQRSAMSDGNYFFFSCVGLLLVACALRASVWPRVWWCAGAGAAFGFGFCVNPSAILFAGCAGGALVIVWRAKAMAPVAALGLVAAAAWGGLNLAMRPYINWEGVGGLYAFHAKWVLGFHPSWWFVRNLCMYGGVVIVAGGLGGAVAAAKSRSPADALLLTLLVGLTLFSVRLSIPFPRVYLPLALALALLAARLASALAASAHRGRSAVIVAFCLFAAGQGVVMGARFIQQRSGYDAACKLLVADGVRKGLTTHSWWTFQTFTRRRFKFVSKALAKMLERDKPDMRTALRGMAEQGYSHLVIDYLFWLYIDARVRQGLDAMLRDLPPTFTVPNPIVAYEATTLEDGALPSLAHEPLAQNIYIYRLWDYAH